MVICSAVKTEDSGLAGSAAHCSRAVMSSIGYLLETRQDLLSRSRDIGFEINLGPRQVADVRIAKAARMRDDEITDGGLVFCVGAPALAVGRRALREGHRHAGGEEKEADGLTVPVMRMLRHLVEI